MHHRSRLAELPVISPPPERDAVFTDAAEAVAELQRALRRGDRRSCASSSPR